MCARHSSPLCPSSPSMPPARRSSGPLTTPLSSVSPYFSLSSPSLSYTICLPAFESRLVLHDIHKIERIGLHLLQRNPTQRLGINKMAGRIAHPPDPHLRLPHQFADPVISLP